MDLAKSRADSFCRISPIRAAAGLLRVHGRSQIARTRADFVQFSGRSGNLKTEWWMTQSDANCSLSEFPDHQGKYREFLRFGAFWKAICSKKTSSLLRFFPRFPTRRNR